MVEEEEYPAASAQEVWDEYRWESYIRRQQDHADQYLAMLEYYEDEGDAHNLIARSMGWDHLLTNCSGAPDPTRCSHCPSDIRRPCRFYESYFGRRERLRQEAHGPLAWEIQDEEEDEAQKTVHGAQHVQWQLVYGQHAIHAQASALVNALGEICSGLPGGFPPCSSPLCRLLHHVHRCVGKIASALHPYLEPSQRGLVIAHLKMAFQAACLALGQVSACTANAELTNAAAESLSRRLLTIRQHLLELIDDFRAQVARLQHR